MNRLLAILSVLTLTLATTAPAMVVQPPHTSALPPASVEIAAESSFSFPVAEDWCRNNTMDWVDPWGLDENVISITVQGPQPGTTRVAVFENRGMYEGGLVQPEFRHLTVTAADVVEGQGRFVVANTPLGYTFALATGVDIQTGARMDRRASAILLLMSLSPPGQVEAQMGRVATAQAVGQLGRAETKVLGQVNRTGAQVAGQMGRTEAQVAGQVCRAESKVVATPLESMLQKVETLDFSTPRNSAVFYSGPGQQARAVAFAERTGGMTINMTPGGKALAADPVFRSLSPTEQFQVWQKASTRFAQGASGRISAFTQGAHPTGIFRTIEEPIIRESMDVTKMTYHY